MHDYVLIYINIEQARHTDEDDGNRSLSYHIDGQNSGRFSLKLLAETFGFFPSEVETEDFQMKCFFFNFRITFSIL